MAAKTRYRWTPDVAVAPGETIREILSERGITQADFAIRLGKTEKFVSQLVNGKASLTHDTAIELERALGVPSAFWNAAEAEYRDFLARQNQEAELEQQGEWVDSFPLDEMASHGWIAREEAPAPQAAELLSFFGVSSVDAYRAYWGSERRLAARMSTAYEPSASSITAWLRAGEIAAEAIHAAPFDPTGFRRVLGDLRQTSRRPPREWLTLVPELCAAVGVAIVFVKDLPETRLHAVSWWSTRTRAVIQLGLRYHTDDQVWFSLYHEAGHLLLDDRTRNGISELREDPMAEQRADRFAADMLIPPGSYEQFTSAGRPSKASVRQFAEQTGVAAGIVVGRLQRDEVIPYNWMNDLKARLDWE